MVRTGCLACFLPMLLAYWKKATRIAPRHQEGADLVLAIGYDLVEGRMT